MSEEDAAPAPAPAPAPAAKPLFKTWVNCTPTGHRLPDLGPQGAAPYVIERYEEQSDNQDFLIKIDDTHPSAYDTNDRSFVRAQVSFYEHCSAMLIPVFKTNKLNTENLQFLDPNHYYLPHPTRSTRETDSRIGTVLHAVDLVWLKHAHVKVPYDQLISIGFLNATPDARKHGEAYDAVVLGNLGSVQPVSDLIEDILGDKGSESAVHAFKRALSRQVLL